MGRLTPKLTQTASKIAITRNEYGDSIYGATSSAACLYRDISTLSHVLNREDVNIDGLLWFEAGHDAQMGDIYLLDGQYLKVERVISAKDLLRTNTEQFVKCEVTKVRQLS